MRQYIDLVEAYQEERQRIAEWIMSFGDPLHLYREIILAPGEQVNTHKLGIHWTPVKESAVSPFGRLDKHGTPTLGDRLGPHDRDDPALSRGARDHAY